MNGKVMSSIRDMFVMTSDGREDIANHVEEVIANAEAVCRAADSRLCWTAGEAMDGELCVVTMRNHEFCGVCKATNETLADVVRRLVEEEMEYHRYEADDGDDNDYAVCVTTRAEVCDKYLKIALFDDEGDRTFEMVVTVEE